MRLLALLLAALLALPAALAHLPYERPSLQRFEPRRDVDASVQAGAARVLLHGAAEPMRHAVRVDAHPATGVRVEHRPDPSRAEGAWAATVRIERLAEYRDLNADLRFTPDVDTPVRTFRWEQLPWRATPVQNVTVGGAKGSAVTWTANQSAGPRFETTLAAAGVEVVDEGARARPQDALLYLELHDLPPRGTGNLHVLEGRVTAPAGATLAEILSTANETVGFHVGGEGRRMFFIWGGEGVIDGREQRVAFTRSSAEGEGANATWTFRLHLPVADHEARFVLVQGIEYETPAQRSPAPGLALLAATLVLAALAGRARQPKR